MAAVTATVDMAQRRNTGQIIRYSGTGASNTDATLTSDVVAEHKAQRLCSVSFKYSGAATQAGTTVVKDNGLGSGFDATYNTGTANAQTTVYVPDGDIWLFPGDAIAALALAGGAVTATIEIVLEQF